jgi:CheY-like chemotaxis protein
MLRKNTMTAQQISILWADDEIDLLKAQILFLGSKGYRIVAVGSGAEALEKVRSEAFDLVFLDEHMPGLTGLEVLPRIKAVRPQVPVVMITKNEEENLMEEAIGSQIADYLIKPVNPNQILLSIKKILDQKRLVGEKTTAEYQQDFRNLGLAFNDDLSAQGWMDTYAKLVYWDVELEKSKDEGMKEVLAMQRAEANRQFTRFIKNEYLDWFKNPSEDIPILSHNLLRKKLFPRLEKNRPTFLFVIDNLRLDQLKVLEPIISEYFQTEESGTYMSILPTSTEFARNALFAGLMPLDIKSRYPDKWVSPTEEEGSRNMHEAFFLQEFLKRSGHDLRMSYHKITQLQQGKQLAENASNLFGHDLVVVVYNFVDMLSHARSEMNVIKELADDEVSYRSITRSWFEHSPLWELMRRVADKKCPMFVTTDHGTVRVAEPVRIVGDRNTNTNLRFKEGKNLSYDNDDLFVIEKPEEARLIRHSLSSSYVFGGCDQYFCYPNNYHHYVNLYRHTFQHGGISLEEMIIPWALYTPR